MAKTISLKRAPAPRATIRLQNLDGSIGVMKRGIEGFESPVSTSVITEAMKTKKVPAPAVVYNGRAHKKVSFRFGKAQLFEPGNYAFDVPFSVTNGSSSKLWPEVDGWQVGSASSYTGDYIFPFPEEGADNDFSGRNLTLKDSSAQFTVYTNPLPIVFPSMMVAYTEGMKVEKSAFIVIDPADALKTSAYLDLSAVSALPDLKPYPAAGKNGLYLSDRELKRAIIKSFTFRNAEGENCIVELISSKSSYIKELAKDDPSFLTFFKG